MIVMMTGNDLDLIANIGVSGVERAGRGCTCGCVDTYLDVIRVGKVLLLSCTFPIVSNSPPQHLS